eukprot:m.184615 g.184615  ORF g.184615 m.184615 type:complete len:778 (+) comp16183_c0_seq1:43-2376(+)
MPKKGAAADDAFGEVGLDVHDPRTLILALTAPEASVAGKAAISLERFADKSENNKEMLVEMGVLPPATALLTHEDQAVRAQSACLLYTVAGSKVARLAIRKDGDTCLPPMVALLKEDAGPVCRENASGFFAYYCEEYSGRVATTRAKGLDGLIQLLVDIIPDAADVKAAQPPPDLVRNTVRALALLFDDYDARAALGDAGGIESLLVLLHSEYTELQSLALTALARACKNARNQMIVRVCGGLEKLLDMVSNTEYTACHAQALEVLGELLSNPDNMMVVAERGPADKQNPNGTAAPIEAVQQYVNAANKQTRAQALLCVARAAAHPDNRRLLMDLKIENAVAARIWSDDPKQPLNPQVAEAAIAACTALAASVSLAEKLAGQGVIQKLLKLLNWQDSPKCGVAAATALAEMTAEGRGSNCIKLVEADPGLSKVVELFQSDNAVHLTAAARLVRHIAITALTASELDDMNLVAGLIKCVTSGDDAAEAAGTAAMAVLAQKASFRTQLVEDGQFCDVAVNLIESPAFDVRQNTFRAIRSAAEDLQLATDLCARGALAKLAASTNSFAAVAYKQLLNQHLPAKFGFNGILELGDVVVSPFFDTGALSSQTSFVGLDKLREVPINTGREVLLADISSTNPDTELVDFIASVRPADGQSADPSELARAVCNRMGGAVPYAQLTAYTATLAINELKQEAGSNVIPLGKIKTGMYYHRALLFKVVGDAINLPSVLVRSAYGRAYNVVYAPKAVVVDVMHEPGSLFPIQDVEQLGQPGSFFEFHR